MARRRASEPEPVEASRLTPEEADRSIIKLRRRIADIEQLQTDGVRWDGGKKRAVETNVEDTVREVFGSGSQQFREFEHFCIDRGGSFIAGSDAEYQQCFLKGIPYAVELLDGLIALLNERKEDYLGEVAASPVSIARSSRRVFVVHGHDHGPKDATARFLSQLDLEAIILHEQPNEGRTIIEKFEKYADVSFAVVILTPDDLGSRKELRHEPQPRARQNVVFELGFFVGKLGRKRVCALHKGDIEMLSDYQGVLFVPMDTDGAWKGNLAREIKAAGISVDLNNAM